MISLGLDDWRREQRAITLGDFPKLGQYLDDYGYRAAGVPVNESSARTVSAFWNGVTVISQSIGVLDRLLYKRVGDDDRERATSHPVYKLIHDQPNDYMSPQVFWETLTSHALVYGNGYAEIEWDGSLRPVALWPIMPDCVVPKVDSYRYANGRRENVLWYQYKGQERIEAEDIVHIPGLGYDGLCGYSVIHMARRSLGLVIAAEEWGSSLFANGGNNGIIAEHPGKLSEEGIKRIRSSFSQDTGPAKAHRLRVLEEGMKLSRPIVIPPDDAQFLETRSFQIEEFARWLNLPPHKIKHKMGERPGGNLEASQIDYLTDTLLPWTSRIEQECNKKLISEAQRSTYYVEHLYQKILRADVTTRMSTYKSLFDMGVVSPEWIAKTENLPPPPVKEQPALPEPAPAPQLPAAKPEQPAPALMNSVRAVALEAMGRYVRRESARVQHAANRGAGGFGDWVDGFYRREFEVFRGFIQHSVALSLSLAGSKASLEKLTEDLAVAYIARSREELLNLPAKDLAEQAEVLLECWERTRPAELADKIAALVAEEEGHAA